MVQIATTQDELRDVLGTGVASAGGVSGGAGGGRRGGAGGGGCVLVPTMGALHAGHSRLIQRGVTEARARGLGSGCVVSIFVNPTQFNEKGDYARYPRTLESDVRIASEAGASVVFVPGEGDVYPRGIDVPVGELPDVATRPGLEDAARPGHFAGVCQVVRRFFAMVRPRVAIFGEKDWQQLQVIRAMVEDEGLGVEIVPAPTERDADGLAMSSRNRFLTESDRERAVAIVSALRDASHNQTVAQAESAMRRVLLESGIEPEYATVRDAVSLLKLESWENRLAAGSKGEPVAGHPVAGRRVLIAARVGSVRLIDNCDWANGPEIP